MGVKFHPLCRERTFFLEGSLCPGKKPVNTARAEARDTKTGANGRTCQEGVAISFPPQCRGVAVCGELV